MNKIFKLLSTLIIICILGWGISSIATDDISSAHNNFSVVGVISNINEESITVDQAKGSDKADKTTYDLNIKYIEKIETNKYQTLNIDAIKVGDRIIAQGLTNGSTFFIKRIISFADVIIPEDNATSTESEPLSSSVDIVISTTTTEGDLSTSVIEDATTASTSVSTTTDSDDNNTVSTSTEDNMDTSTTTSTTTDSVVEQVIDVIEEIIDTVVDTVTNIIGDNSQSSSTDPIQVQETEPEFDSSTSTSEELINNEQNQTSSSTE